MGVKISSRQMSLGPSLGSIQVHIKVDPLTAGCPQQANPTVNRLPPADKASIHSRPPAVSWGRSGRLLFLPLSMRWMMGKHRQRESLFRPGDILDCVWHLKNPPPTSLALTQSTYGVPKHLNTYAKEIRLPLTMTARLGLSHSHMGIKSVCTNTHTRVRYKGWYSAQKGDTILCPGQAGWWIWWINHPSLFHQDISHQTGWWLMGRLGEERRGRGRAGGSLWPHLTPDGNLYGWCLFKLATSTRWFYRVG